MFWDLEREIEYLREENALWPILVEGERDVEALRALGCAGEIVKLNRGESLERAAQSLSLYGDVILLLDWDEKGVELTARISVLIRAHGARPHLDIWRRLSALTSGRISSVEELPSLYERLRDEERG